MADNTKIEWADATVNAVNGCSVISPGCTNCYAMKQAHRFPIRQGLTRKTNGGMVWTGEVRLSETQLLLPLRWKRPRRIFWNAHGDLFHDAVPDEWIDSLFAVCALTPQHRHLILTKRSKRMREYMEQSSGRIADAIQPLRTDNNRSVGPVPHVLPGRLWWPLPNVWLGVSVEDQARADERIPDLLATPAAVRWLSCEPLLGPVNLNHVKMVDYVTEGGGSVQGWESALNGKRFDEWSDGDSDGWPKLDWIVAGGESGPGSRPMHPDWARSLRDQCASAGVPFFFKQWGEWCPSQGTDCDVGRWSSEEVRYDGYDWRGAMSSGEVPLYDTMNRVGKARAGRLLDGRLHDDFPA